MNSKKAALWIFFLSVLSWANSAYTLWHHIKLNAQGLAEQSFCNVGSGFNCDLTAFSPYAVFLGIPTAAWALLFHTVVMVLGMWLLFAASDKKEEEEKKAKSLLLLISAIGMLPTLFLAAVSLFVLKNICLLCFITYILNTATFIVAFFARDKEEPWKLSLKLPTWVWVTSLTLLAASFFTPEIMKSSIPGQKLDEVMLNKYRQAHLSAEKKNINLNNVPFSGNPDAKVVLVEYSDFQCPFCARSSETLSLYVQSKSELVKHVYKHFPLDASCNPHVSRSAHPLACLAAKTVLCVHQELGNKAYVDLKVKIFRQQASLSRDMIEKEAVALGMDQSKLRECRESVAIQERLLKDINEAQRIGVQGTPSFFINGKLAQGAQFPAVLDVLVEAY